MIRFTWQLRALAEARDLTATRLVERLALAGAPLSLSQVCRLLDEQPLRPRIEVLGALCEIFQCVLDDLLTVPKATERRTGTGLPPDVGL